MALNPICLRCLRPMPAERKALGIDRCLKCQPQWMYKGTVEYGHKTGGAVKPLHPAVYKNHMKVTHRSAKGTNGAAMQRGTTSVIIKDA